MEARTSWNLRARDPDSGASVATHEFPVGTQRRPVVAVFFSGCFFGAGGSFGVVVVAGRFVVAVAFEGLVRGSERVVRVSGMVRCLVSECGEFFFPGTGMVLVASDRDLATGGSRFAVLAFGLEAVRAPPSVSQPGFVPGCGPVSPASCLAT